MKTFNASVLGSTRRTEIFTAAKDGGAIIQRKNTNGVVIEEFVLVDAKDFGEVMRLSREMAERLIKVLT